MKKEKGFTLLLAVITTSFLLLVSFVVISVATKQLIIGASNQQSQYAFYNADSGTECALYWDLKISPSPFDATPPTAISCGGSSITPTKSPIVAGYATTTFTVNLTTGCAVVEVTKKANASTTLNAHGYNTCSGTALRRYERGIQIAY